MHLEVVPGTRPHLRHRHPMAAVAPRTLPTLAIRKLHQQRHRDTAHLKRPPTIPEEHRLLLQSTQRTGTLLPLVPLRLQDMITADKLPPRLLEPMMRIMQHHQRTLGQLMASNSNLSSSNNNSNSNHSSNSTCHKGCLNSRWRPSSHWLTVRLQVVYRGILPHPPAIPARRTVPVPILEALTRHPLIPRLWRQPPMLRLPPTLLMVSFGGGAPVA